MAKTKTTPADPKNPATKPQGTTADQIATMESEGQAQGPAPAGASPAHGRGVRQPAAPEPAKGRS
ncbi:MAG: hypothetical protein ABI880_08575 [Acidobacteriota bacterium]